MVSQIIGFTIPALVVFACVWVVLGYQYRAEDKKRLWELQRASAKEITQIRLRAYERLVLLLERTEPEHLLVDMDINSLSIIDMQRSLLRTVRMEFDHNLSQQVYVSDRVWEHILQARDEMASFISTMAQQMPKDSTSLQYAQVLLTAYRNNGITPHQTALNLIKEEARQLLDHR
ncbi:MAG: hypothetical protein IJS00_04440 [Paludibacteraceae bacterium]|nr:hypothetical protein [Paludibacteraceae bacterium]